MRALALACVLAAALAGCAASPPEDDPGPPRAFVVGVFAESTQELADDPNGTHREPTTNGAARYAQHCGQGTLGDDALTWGRPVALSSDGRPPPGWDANPPAAAIYIEDRDGRGVFGNAPTVIVRDALPLTETLSFFTGNVALVGGGDVPLRANDHVVPAGGSTTLTLEREHDGWRYLATIRVEDRGVIELRQVPAGICV